MSGESPSKSNKKSAVSNVVNDLIRAAVGGDTNNVADDDIDKYVADLILREAEAKRKKYDNEGVRAYQPDFGAHQPNNLPKPNKRFFLNMIKATDSYNQSLKEQEEIAKKQEQDLKQRKRRHKDEYSSDEYQKKRRHHYDSAQNNSDSRKSANDDNDQSSRRRGGKQYDNAVQQRRHESSSSQCDDDKSNYGRRSSKERRHNTHHRNPSPSRNNCSTTTHGASEKSTSLPVVVRGRGQATQGSSSNMDKYFSKNYDPLLDVEPDLNEMVYTQYIDGGDDLKTKKKRKKDKKDRKKKSKKKKSKKEKEETDSNDDDSDYVRVESPPPLRKPIRAWDVGK